MFLFLCYFYRATKCRKIAWMPQSWIVVVHIKAYSFKLQIFREGFWTLLVKNSLVQKYPEKLGLEGTFRLVFTRNGVMTSSFSLRPNTMVQRNTFPSCVKALSIVDIGDNLWRLFPQSSDQGRAGLSSNGDNPGSLVSSWVSVLEPSPDPWELRGISVAWESPGSSHCLQAG